VLTAECDAPWSTGERDPYQNVHRSLLHGLVEMVQHLLLRALERQPLCPDE